jgi:cystathionine beta-lyase/cystathionine gamma-synthase
MQEKRMSWGPHTKVNHPVEISLVHGNVPLLQPIYHSAKFKPSEDHPYMDQFMYGRISNPTVRQLELTLAELQKREDCIVVSSGIGALTGTLLGLLKAGDHVISFRELYKPARAFIRDFLPRYNIESTFLKLNDLPGLEASIIPGKTKLIHFESPSNPNLEIADIDAILRIAKKYQIMVSMDGTFAGLHQHLDVSVDLMIHSLTKFGNGHGDVIAGSISGRKDLIKSIRESCHFFGAALDPQAAYLIERGLKTYFLRYERQTKTAQEVAKFLMEHPKVRIVRYPGSELAKKQMKDMGAVIAFEISPEAAPSADKFCHKLKLIQLAASVGSTETIIAPTMAFFGLDLSHVEREEMGLNNYSLRISIGLEDPNDLITDLKGALE